MALAWRRPTQGARPRLIVCVAARRVRSAESALTTTASSGYYTASNRRWGSGTATNSGGVRQDACPVGRYADTVDSSNNTLSSRSRLTKVLWVSSKQTKVLLSRS